jgi:hypothetical protein
MNLNFSNKNNNELIDRPFEIVPGGEYDQYGCYHTPEGSFWDPDGVYFNKNGLDRHGGYYDENMEYNPGAGWLPDLMCYMDEKEETMKKRSSQQNHGQQRGRRGNRRDNDELDEAGDDLDDIDVLYEEVNYENLMQEEDGNYLANNNSSNFDNFTNNKNTNINNKNLNKNTSKGPTPVKEITNQLKSIKISENNTNKNKLIGASEIKNPIGKEKQIKVEFWPKNFPQPKNGGGY